MTNAEFLPTPATTPRVAARASFDRQHAYEIIDEAPIAHVGFIVDGMPAVMPMAIGRIENRLIIHGSVATRIFRTAGESAQVCVTITHLDGLVLARSQFHHSMNYRSVVIIGETRRLRDAPAVAALEAVVNHVLPGRTSEARSITDVELRQTFVSELDIEQASVKTRSGGPIDDEEDLDLDVWAGVIPLSLQAGTPVPDNDGPPPQALQRWCRSAT